MKILKRILGEKRYCKWFHGGIGVPEAGYKMYYCDKCKITQFRGDDLIPG